MKRAYLAPAGMHPAAMHAAAHLPLFACGPLAPWLIYSLECGWGHAWRAWAMGRGERAGTFSYPRGRKFLRNRV